LRTCPNGRCKQINDDEINQCPNCGANMNRNPDAPVDMNAHLYSLRANAGMVSAPGGQGSMRVGAEPVYKDTRAVAEVAREIVLADLLDLGAA